MLSLIVSINTYIRTYIHVHTYTYINVPKTSDPDVVIIQGIEGYINPGQVHMNLHSVNRVGCE